MTKAVIVIPLLNFHMHNQREISSGMLHQQRRKSHCHQRHLTLLQREHQCHQIRHHREQIHLKKEITVVTVRNLKTWYISPQYHIFFDDLFETTFRRGQNDPVIDQICNDIFDSIWDWYAEEEYDPGGQLIYRPPPLADVWIDEPGRRERWRSVD